LFFQGGTTVAEGVRIWKQEIVYNIRLPRKEWGFILVQAVEERFGWARKRGKTRIVRSEAGSWCVKVSVPVPAEAEFCDFFHRLCKQEGLSVREEE